ncbi:hypothetical protein ACHAQA_006297 [Verticillium albo-atrum]
MLHYLGCIRHELARFKNLASKEHVDQKVRKRVHAKREKWKAECERGVRRFEFLRQTLDASEDEAHFGATFDRSLKEWKASDEYKTGIALVERAKLNPRPSNPLPKPVLASVPTLQSEDSGIRHVGGYDPEKDLNVHIIRYENSEDKPEDDYQSKGCESNDRPPAHVSKRQMPSEQTKVEAVLRDQPNNRMSELRLGTTGESLAYVHFPANNMDWIERAIARYYGQDAPDYDGVIRELQGAYKTETYMILRPQYWRGQMHGYSVKGLNYGMNQKGLHVDRNGRILLSPLNKKRNIGQLLLDAARLYEAMSSFRDRMVLKKYLYHEPPLHPRRTLDQAYYWTLNTTKSRDRDQVVYRATTAKQQDFHQFVDGKCSEHEELDGKPCRICTSGIKKISRVVMVDQLWMWILDEKTIITSFPKRYGTQKYDHSGVHKAIRTKLDNARPNQIRSVFDLGLLVIDECSNTFFDRARTTDRQPQVIDQFSEAIGNVVGS